MRVFALQVAPRYSRYVMEPVGAKPPVRVAVSLRSTLGFCVLRTLSPPAPVVSVGDFFATVLVSFSAPQGLSASRISGLLSV